MKKIIDKKLILSYISGEYIENIEELENNINFMSEVIKLTKDKNMYNMCSDTVKKDYEFIKFIILTFKEDKAFITPIAKEYLNKRKSIDKAKILELIFIMTDIYKNDKTSEESFYFHTLKTSYITSARVQAEAIINSSNDEELKKYIGLGFAIIESRYYKSPIILNTFATSYLEEIFYNQKSLPLKTILHTTIPNKDILLKMGIKNYILSYTSHYDESLRNYLEVHPELLKDLEKDIQKIYTNWDKYTQEIEIRKKLIFDQEASNIIEKYDSLNTLEDYCQYINRMHIKGLPTLIDYEIEDEIEYIPTININNITELRCLKEIISLAKELFQSNKKGYIPEEKILPQNINHNKKAKIVPFKS